MFKRLSEDLRSEWFDKLADEVQADPAPKPTKSLSAHLPRQPFDAPQSHPRRMSAISSKEGGYSFVAEGPNTAGALESVDSIITSTNSSNTTATSNEDPSSVPMPILGHRSGKSVSSPLFTLPNAPGSSSQATQDANIATLRYPAINRVLRMSKLHEPYVNRKDRKEKPIMVPIASRGTSGSASGPGSDQGSTAAMQHDPSKAVGSPLTPVREEEDPHGANAENKCQSEQASHARAHSASFATLRQGLAEVVLMDSTTDEPMR